MTEGGDVPGATVPGAVAPDAATCDELMRENALSAIDFQKTVLRALIEVEGLSLESARPFLARMRFEGTPYTIRLDGAYKRYRHGEVEPSVAAEEIKAALGLPGVEVEREGPYPRLARRSDLAPEVFALDCDFDPELAIHFVWVLPHGHVPIRAAEVARDWPDPRRLWANALEALRARTEGAPATGVGEGCERLLRWHHGDGLDAAALLLPDLREEVAGWVEGSLLMAAPARDLLVALGDADEAHVDRVTEEVREAYEKLPEPISPRLYAVG